MTSEETFIIGLGGPSCSGKSGLAAVIEEFYNIKTVTIISMDAYYHDLSYLPLAQRHRRNFDHLEAFDTELLFRHIESLKAGQHIKMPVYDFKVHNRKKEVRDMAPSPIIIVDGIFALYFKELRGNYNLKIYLDIDEPTILKRRIDRDFNERARSESSVRRQFAATVRPMNRRYIIPSAKYADIVLDGRETADNLRKDIIQAIEARMIR